MSKLFDYSSVIPTYITIPVLYLNKGESMEDGDFDYKTGILGS